MVVRLVSTLLFDSNNATCHNSTLLCGANKIVAADSPRVSGIPRKCFPSPTASLKAISSASVVEVAPHVCHLAARDIAQYPPIRLLASDPLSAPACLRVVFQLHLPIACLRSISLTYP